MTLRLTGEKDLQFDEQTAYPGVFGSTFQYCEDRDAIAYFNNITQSIVYFDYKSGSTIGKTQLETIGPDGVGGEPYYVYYHNKDSIFVISRFNNFNLTLVNSDGSKINSFNYYIRDGLTPLPSRIFGAVVIRSPFIYLSTQISDQIDRERQAPIIRIHMGTREVVKLEEPLPYKNVDRQLMVNSHQFEFYEVRMAADSDNEELIVSYPLESQLYRVSNEKVTRVSISSDLIGDFRLLPRDRYSYSKDSKQLKVMIYGSAWYFGVLYDPFRDVYYRIGKAAPDMAKVRRKISGEEVKIPYEYVIITLDKELRKIHELKISTKEAIVHRGIFVGPEGLHIAQLNLKGEDVMGFSTFVLTRNDEE